MFEQIGQFVYFALLSIPAAAAALLRPRELLRQLHSILLGALPLGLATGLALGVVVWIHLRGVVGAQMLDLVPEYLAMAVVLEFAPMGAGLVVAGRSGASLGAEFGSMKHTEQLDALEMLGASPLRFLVGPRVLACMLTLPILTIFIAVMAIGSSFVAEMLGGSLAASKYESDVWNGLARGKMLSSTLKTMVFGWLIATTGCWCGMKAEGGTVGVGQAATRGVVYSILLVLLANVILVKLIDVLGV